MEKRLQGIEDIIKERYRLYFHEELSRSKSKLIEQVVGLTIQLVEDMRKVRVEKIINHLESAKKEIEILHPPSG